MNLDDARTAINALSFAARQLTAYAVTSACFDINRHRPGTTDHDFAVTHLATIRRMVEESPDLAACADRIVSEMCPGVLADPALYPLSGE